MALRNLGRSATWHLSGVVSAGFGHGQTVDGGIRRVHKAAIRRYGVPTSGVGENLRADRGQGFVAINRVGRNRGGVLGSGRSGLRGHFNSIQGKQHAEQTGADEGNSGEAKGASIALNDSGGGRKLHWHLSSAIPLVLGT